MQSLPVKPNRLEWRAVEGDSPVGEAGRDCGGDPE